MLRRRSVRMVERLEQIDRRLATVNRDPRYRHAHESLADRFAILISISWWLQHHRLRLADRNAEARSLEARQAAPRPGR